MGNAARQQAAGTPIGDRPNPTPGPRARIPALDQIRGAAILGVVAFHALATAHRGHVHQLPFFLWPVAAGKLGVDVLFVLSGYVIARSWNEKSKKEPMRFFVRRARRLFPAYWASLIVLVAVRGRSLVTSQHGVGTLLLHAVGQQFLSPRAAWEINSAYWTLTPQIHFYLLFPVLMLVMSRLRSRWTVPLGLVVISVAFRLALHTLNQWPTDTIVGRIDQFAVGMAAALVASRIHPRLAWVRSRAAMWSAVGGVVAILFLYGSLWAHPNESLRTWAETLVHPAFSSLLAIAFCGIGVTRARIGWIGSRPARALGWLGTISYSVYLWHLPMFDWLGRAGGPGLVGAFAATVVVATISYLILERPSGLRALRPKARRVEPSVAGAGFEPATSGL